MGGRELLPEILFMDQLILLLYLSIILSSFMTIISVNPIHSVFWLVILFISSSGVLLCINFEFIALMIIIIYIGAITILFLFVIMMIDTIQLKETHNIKNSIPITILISTSLLLQGFWLMRDADSIFFNRTVEDWDFNQLSQIKILGYLLYTDYYYSFIIISVLLLAAMIGAIILTLEKNTLSKKQNLSNQHHRNNSWI